MCLENLFYLCASYTRKKLVPEFFSLYYTWKNRAQAAYILKLTQGELRGMS